jgi:hypothetical protein
MLAPLSARYGERPLHASTKKIQTIGERTMQDITDLIIIEKVIDRFDAAVPDSYVSWASAFVKIRIGPSNPKAKYQSMRRRSPSLNSWQQLELKKSAYVRQIGERDLYLTEYDDGWTVELTRPDQFDRDPRILTYILGELPILCPTFSVAATLAEACCPKPKSLVYWHAYW